MATIGSLVLKIAANANSLRTGLRSAAGDIRSFSSKAGSVLRTGLAMAAKAAAAGVAALAAAIAVGAAKIRDWYNEQSEAIDTSAKMAHRLGIATDTLMGWEVAADRVGVKTEDLHGVLAQLDKKIGLDLIGVSKEAGIALAKLGLSVQQVAGMDPAERFELLIEKLGELDRAELQGVLPKLFEEQGNKITNLIEAGVPHLRKYVDLTRQWGVAVSDIDAGKVESANDALRDAQDLFIGFKRQLTVELAPIVQTLSESFLKAGSDGRSMAETVSEAVLEMTIAMLEAAEATASAINSLRNLGAWWDKTRTKVGAAASNKIADITGDMDFAISDQIVQQDLNAIDRKLSQPSTAEKIRKKLEEFRLRIQRRGPRTTPQGDGFLFGEKALRDAALAATRNAELEAARQKLATDFGTKLAAEVATPWETFQSRMQQLDNFLRARGPAGWDLYARGVAQAVEQLEKASMTHERLERTAPSLDPRSQEGLRAVRNFQTAGRAEREKREKKTERLLEDMKRQNQQALEHARETARNTRALLGLGTADIAP